MKSWRAWWLIYGVSAVAVGAAMVWITVMVLSLERSELEARQEAQFQESLRLAMWRMESWLGPRVNREANRPAHEYTPYVALPAAYTKGLSRLEPGEVVTQSPLLGFESDIFRLHFQIDERGVVTSPQVPEGNFRDIIEEYGPLTKAVIDDNGAELTQVAQLIPADKSELSTMMACNALPEPAEEVRVVQSLQGARDDEAYQAAKSKAEVVGRAQAAWMAQQQDRGSAKQQALAADEGSGGMKRGPAPARAATGDMTKGDFGPFVPVWFDLDTDEPRLVLMRETDDGGGRRYQGVLCNWSALRAQLLAEIGHLFAEARLQPVNVTEVDDSERAQMLMTIPAVLSVVRPPVEMTSMVTPARMVLLVTWLAVLGAMLVAATALRESIAFGERRSRFASAVTHELRTPLTTFRMYSEMLADDMVTDEAQRKVYLNTLKDESDRLSTLVENVLAYSRVEDGRAQSQVQRISVEGLVQRVRPPLVRRAESAGLELVVQTDGDMAREFSVDVEAVGQILFNLVDNASKYSVGGDVARLELEVDVNASAVHLRVRDHGPGVAPEVAESIFTPFDRGRIQPGDTIPGVGLGLALSRELSRQLGGNLALEPGSGGACFRLTLPTR